MPEKLKVDFCSHSAALYACKNWHYSGCMPTGKMVKVGVWELGEFVGVVLFSRGASHNLLDRYKIEKQYGCELTRIALRKHSTNVSKIVRLSIILLKKKSPNMQLIVSFADPENGHHGGIYQAGNWLFTGKSDPTPEYFISGKWTHHRGGFYKRNSSTPTRRRKGKFRYLMPLNKKIRKRILPLSLPYPKK